MKRILLIVIYCIALMTLVACGNNPDRAKVSDDFATIHYGGAVYHEYIRNGGTDYFIIDESPIKVGSFFSSFYFGFIPIYVSDYDDEKNILYAGGQWYWTKEGFEFPDHFTCRLKKIDAWSIHTESQSAHLVSTLWEDNEESLTLEGIIDTSNPVDDLPERAEYNLHCYLVDYPYLEMGRVYIYYHDAEVYLSVTIDFVDTYYKVYEEYIPLFDF